jgi:hypothetical protein
MATGVTSRNRRKPDMLNVSLNGIPCYPVESGHISQFRMHSVAFRHDTRSHDVTSQQTAILSRIHNPQNTRSIVTIQHLKQTPLCAPLDVRRCQLRFRRPDNLSSFLSGEAKVLFFAETLHPFDGSRLLCIVELQRPEYEAHNTFPSNAEQKYPP